MKKAILPLIILLGLFTSFDALLAQNIALELNLDQKNQMQILEGPPGNYEINTTGGDPWIKTYPISDDYDPDKVYVISFEYIAESGLDDLQIFYGTPLSPSRRVQFGSLAPSSNYTTFKAFMKLEAPVWNESYGDFRFDFGKASGQSIKIKNLQLRAAQPNEVIALNLDPGDTNQMTAFELPNGSFQIETSGNDPWITTTVLNTTYNPEKVYVISFDYTSQSGLDDLQIFYGTPFSGSRRAVLGSLPPAISPTRFTTLMRISASSWNSSYSQFRFDFGKSPGLDITIDNLVLREPTNQEKKAFEIEETVDIMLDISKTSADLVASEIAAGTYEFNTSGNDPWILSRPLIDLYDVEESYIISFEYKTEQAYNELEIFFGPPISSTRKFNAGKLPAVSDWTTFTINPRLLIDNFQDGNWSLFRFDFGKNENEEKTIFIRNIKIRKPTLEEVEEEQNSDKFVSRAINQEFLNYLDQNFSDTISMVKIEKDSVTIKGILEEVSENLFLAEIEPHQYGFNLSTFNFVTPLQVETDTFSIRLPRYVPEADHNYDRLYSRWAIVKKSGEDYTFLSYAKWAEDISAIVAHNIEEDKAASIKGLDGLTPGTIGNFDDLIDLGIESMKINLLLNGVFSLNPTGLIHEFNGKTYNINPSFVQNLDERIKMTTEAGIKTTFVLLIPRNIGNQQLREIFVHPDATLSPYSMANVATAKGVEYYTAMVDFLAKRYSRPDKKYGRLSQWIIHNEVDAHTNWTHAGQKPVELYTQIYDRSLRLVHYTIRKHNPSAKVFASFTKHWNSKAGSAANFKSKNVLKTLLKISKKEGDYEWNIAWHSYPANLFDPTVWNDPPARAQFNFNTPEITPFNLEMIDAYVRQKKVLYNGKKVRTVLLSENGFSSNGAKNENASETTQAAAVAYFWKKANNRLPSIENIQLHRWVDNPNEAGLLFGLWTVKEGTVEGFYEKKESWYVWEAAGTSRENEVFDPYKDVIGIESWSEIQNDVATEVTPFKVEMQIEGCNAELENLFVRFNGEIKVPQEDGSLVFYNVASNVPQPYQIRKGDTILSSDTLYVSRNLTLNIKLDCPKSEVVFITKKKDNEDILEGINILFNGENKVTDSLGKAIFTVLEKDTLILKVQDDKYTLPQTPSFFISTDTIIELSLVTKASLLALSVQHLDGDDGGTGNKQIRPHLKIYNNDSVSVDYSDVTLRYWFTAENYTGINIWIDYAVLGTSKVNAEYVPLHQPREGAFGYVEYGFDQSAGALDPGTNSGQIMTRFANEEWDDLDEINDYSYQPTSSYTENQNITLYYNGELVWGVEPDSLAPEKKIKVFSENRRFDPNDNTISMVLRINNVGNVPLDYSGFSLRYWFTSEGTTNLNYWIDYAKLGKSNLSGSFMELNPVQEKADHYFELSVSPGTGSINPLSNSGEIQLRITKSDWSNFDETNDHSYKDSYNPTINNRITVYYKGELLFGVEPLEGNNLAVKTAEKGSSLLTVYPNPTKRYAIIKWSEEIFGANNFFLKNYLGNSYKVEIIQKNSNEIKLIFPNLSTGIYLLVGKINGNKIVHRMLIE